MDPITAVVGLVTSIVSKVWPDKTEQQKQEFTLALTRELNETQLLTKQIDVNVEEAKSSNIFVAGWRPFIGWVCGLAFAWQFIGLPIFLFISNALGHPVQPPVFDTASMTTVLLGMLGLGSLRTYEKVKTK